MNTLNVLQAIPAPAAAGKGSASSVEGATGFGAAMQVALDIAGMGQPQPGQAASDTASVRLPNNDGGAPLSQVEMTVPEAAVDAGGIGGTAAAEPEFAGLDTPGSAESRELTAPAPGVVSASAAPEMPVASHVIFEASPANEVPAQQAADSVWPQSGTSVPDELLPEALVSQTPKPAPAVVLPPGLSTSVASSAGEPQTARGPAGALPAVREAASGSSPAGATAQPISRQGTAPLDGAAVPAPTTGSLAPAASIPTAATGTTAATVTTAGVAGPAGGSAPVSLPSDVSVAAAPASQTTAADLPVSLTTPPSQVPATPPAQTPAVAATAPAPAAAPAPAPVPLPAQLARPIFTLANATPGEHTLTINVAPDNLGPVTVRAHVTGEGLRVELFAPTDVARDALRAILPELRRDVSGQGMHANLDLSSQDQPRDGNAAGTEEGAGRNPERSGRPRTADQVATEHAGTVPENNVRTGLSGPASTIDVMV